MVPDRDKPSKYYAVEYDGDSCRVLEPAGRSEYGHNAMERIIGAMYERMRRKSWK